MLFLGIGKVLISLFWAIESICGHTTLSHMVSECHSYMFSHFPGLDVITI